MTTIVQTDLVGLDLVRRGYPYAPLVKSTVDTTTLDFYYRGYPFYAPSASGSPPPTYNATQFFMLF
jgi:hypothetical protein